MTKREALTSELERKSGKAPVAEPAQAKPKEGYAPPSRVGKITFAIHVDPAVKAQMKLIAAETGRTVQDLTSEALNVVFKAHGKKEIAKVSDGRSMPKAGDG
jgi:hypothetical protein